MSNSPANWGELFDVRRIRRLVEMMTEYGLTEIDLRHAETRIRLSRAMTVDASAPTIRATAAPAAVPSAAPAAAPAAAASEPAAKAAHLHEIKSPMVGTFYASSSPDTPAYVKVGDHVGPDTTICLVEAMKVFNEIPAEVSGKVVAVLVDSGEPVEFGQPLFRVDTRG